MKKSEAACIVQARFKTLGWELYAYEGFIFWRAPTGQGITEGHLQVLKESKKHLLPLLNPVPLELLAEVGRLFALRPV